MTNLRSERRARNLSLEQVADAIGCSRAAVSLWECGKRRPTGVRRRALERFFGAPLDELLQFVNDDDRASSNADAVA